MWVKVKNKRGFRKETNGFLKRIDTEQQNHYNIEMAYSQDYRQMVLDKVNRGQPVRSIANELNISTQTIQRWKRNAKRKQRLFKPHKIDNEALKRDVEMYPDDYQHERALRFNCSQKGISLALKRIGITQKKDTKPPKS